MKNGKGKWKKAPSNPNVKNRFNQFEGYYEMDKKNGYGEFIWESGNKYSGNYHKDERQGYGTMTWTDGSKYMGHWVKGVQHGVGLMFFHDGTKRAGFFENNIFMLPLTEFMQIKDLESDMPLDLKAELHAYLHDRNQKVAKMKDDGLDVQSQLDSEKNFMGQQLLPRVEKESEDENKDKMQELQGMVQEVGQQVNQRQSKEPFINHEGLKRVYKPKAEREADKEAEALLQKQQQVQEQ